MIRRHSPKSINSVCWNNTEAEGWGSSLPFRPLRAAWRRWNSLRGLNQNLLHMPHWGSPLPTPFCPWAPGPLDTALLDFQSQGWQRRDVNIGNHTHPGAPCHIRGSGFCCTCMFSNFYCIFHLKGVERRAVAPLIRRLSCSSWCLWVLLVSKTWDDPSILSELRNEWMRLLPLEGTKGLHLFRSSWWIYMLSWNSHKLGQDLPHLSSGQAGFLKATICSFLNENQTT